MMKRILKKVLGRGKLMVLAVVVALTLATASPALAANGGSFILGVLTNTATAITQLTANIANPALKLTNTSTSTGATALDLQTASTKPPMTVNSQTKVSNLNADAVDGKDSTALGVTTSTNHQKTGECDTPLVSTECASVTVKVPTGKQYNVTVFSSFAAQSESDNNIVYYCPAIKGGSYTTLSCIEPGDADGIALPSTIETPKDTRSAASSAEIGPLPAGTYTISTAINPRGNLVNLETAEAHTTVLVRDASAPGPPIK